MMREPLNRWWRRRRSRLPDLMLPPLLETATGQPRRLGLEFEFSGLPLTRIGELVHKRLGGRIELISDYETKVCDTPWGDFGIELDFAWLKAMGGEEAPDTSDFAGGLEQLSEELLATIARQVVPFEIVTPPIPFRDLGIIDSLTADLRRAGAKGTRHSPIYAFGLHLNPELPDLEAETLTRYLKAYIYLYEWLRERSRLDLARRMSPYIEPYPSAYARLVGAPEYWPDRDQLIDDYLEHNPTRNRALDMLPAFFEVDESRVRAVVKDSRVKGRPALHYRLPNCQIDEPDWSWRDIWRDWLQVEHLAHDRARLDEIGAAFTEFHASMVDRLVGDWVRKSRQWLLDEDALAGR
jgi:hypothetical protein